MKKHVLRLASSVFLFGLIVGCSSQTASEPSASESGTTSNPSASVKQKTPEAVKSEFPQTDLTDSIAIDAVNENPSIRAEQQVDRGTLLMISKGREERGHLLVSSTLGQEGDQTFQSHYSIVYRQGEKDQVLLELPNFQYVQPTDKKLPFEHMSFKNADVYILTPQYKTGHGVEGYVFAIDKENGHVFPLKIVKNEITHKALIYYDGKIPTVEEDTLVVVPPVGAGTPEEDTKDVHYRLDLNNKQLAAE